MCGVSDAIVKSFVSWYGSLWSSSEVLWASELAHVFGTVLGSRFGRVLGAILGGAVGFRIGGRFWLSFGMAFGALFGGDSAYRRKHMDKSVCVKVLIYFVFRLLEG